ncbi:hypothetical protein J2T60_002319 [Natronospira proteinivora]|uniref:Histidine kinase/DNA gyrase B/HSP90-like ATPase n=1 Tax=Natronospira proteinivora TaxID=1807133 RepID=A0ABT1GAJ3_9GAMM|nr:hypothetical protein [Natronospira proteinivora]MCP1728319.1 hypothetical protein [Natronospira proteinivora]
MLKPRDAELRDRLSHANLFVTGTINQQPNDRADSPADLIPCFTGIHSDEHLEELLDLIAERLYLGSIKQDEELKLYRSLTEAMLNVWQHAYGLEGVIQGGGRSLGRRWWLFGERIDNQLFLAIYDRGVGIPVTLPKKYGWESIYSVMDSLGLKGNHDTNMIRAAIELGRTSRKSGRGGKGLRDVHRYVEENPVGDLRIYSNRGEYRYRSSSGVSRSIVHKRSLIGTLIQWNIAVPQGRKVDEVN